MTERYWIGGFFVDVPRNQITHNKQAQTLPPKALAVLTYLAERQGEVVSQDELLTNVWKGTVVSPNTLQRCIAQLRKAFGDDGKVQSFIKTHAKKGYSLESDIRWENALTPNKPTSSPAVHEISDKQALSSATTLDSKKPVRLLPAAFACVVAVIVTIVAFLPSSDPKHVLQIDDIRLLTSTDNRELASTYSPDGQYIVFQRFPEVMCQSHLWAKHIETQQEFQLTQALGSYGSLAFSHDGTSLTFVKENNCTAPVQQKKCFHLQSLDFDKALSGPQAPTTLMECKNTEIKSPIWLDGDTIALLQKTQERWRLIRYVISENASSPLYDVANGSIVSFDFAAHDNTIALTTVHEKGILHIEKLSINGELLSSTPIDYQGVIPPYSYIYPNVMPEQADLIFSTGKQLFTVDFDGTINRITMPLTDAIGTPIFHPFEKKMLAIKGHYDSDIVAVPMAQFAAYNTALETQPDRDDVQTTDINFYTLIRSIQEENRAKYQPNGSLIAYSSEGDGTSQVWTAEVHTQSASFPHSGKPFSHFPTNSYVRDVLWSKDGNSMLINASSELKHRYLSGFEPGTETSIELDYPVRNLFHWDSEQQTILANILYQGVLTFVSIDLTTGAFTPLSDNAVTWAVKTESDALIFTDAMGRFWQVGSIENTLISELEHQGSDKHFIAKGNTLYGINDDFQLWRYTLENGAFELLGQLPDTVDYITDINDNAILLTLRVAARKDVVELTLQ
ncbi:winged helix-turn-helix domain-containing protein [Alteromonas sp. 009811495]|uniref:winged helix-turn-helix domain-containing protein n=1 Tax=Alteromonas sp. 009811495 TaxID=3002962 RepID=UPI00237E474A|nr:transcriptional regulator [Alteromonas sp. 009811495]WDT85984.1 transcriptional regulator [Alteromonas sp. 009811495]